MQITYDPAKDARNVSERGLPFALVRDFEWFTALILQDDRFDYGEFRYRAMGYIGDLLHIVVFPPRVGAVHVISFRKANKREVKIMTKKPSPEMVDTANPEWSAEDFAKAKPASEVLVGLFGSAQAKEMLKPKRGRPKSAATKEHVNVRFDAEVLEKFRASGPGWQTRMNAALADWLKTHTPDELKA